MKSELGTFQDAFIEALNERTAAPIAEPVWALYRRLIDRVGPRPTLIERDDDIPAFAVLMAERNRAHGVLTRRELAHV